MYLARAVLVLALFIANKGIEASIIGKDFSLREPWQHLEPLDHEQPLTPSHMIGIYLHCQGIDCLSIIF